MLQISFFEIEAPTHRGEKSVRSLCARRTRREDQPGMSNLFQRVFGYVANEFLVEFLANNRLFQRFVVKSTKKFEEGYSAGRKKLEDLQSTEAAQRITSKLDGSKGYFSVFSQTFFGKFRDEVAKEVKKHLRR